MTTANIESNSPNFPTLRINRNFQGFRRVKALYGISFYIDNNRAVTALDRLKQNAIDDCAFSCAGRSDHCQMFCLHITRHDQAGCKEDAASLRSLSVAPCFPNVCCPVSPIARFTAGYRRYASNRRKTFFGRAIDDKGAGDSRYNCSSRIDQEGCNYATFGKVFEGPAHER